ncbi:MAG: T9SS type A sorting domain-containing protein [Candidatus Krumholzibacteria bacterium]|nr:T9SS type A sorting domain-containing protein [Candidatus Krumholzibacteria bacterium]
MKRLGLFVLSLVLFVPGAAKSAAGDWNVYINASAINRITCSGDSLWCATYGGILVYDLSDSTFTQYMDGLGLRSSLVSAVTVDRHGSVWVGHVSSGIDRIDDIETDPYVKHYSYTLEGLISDNITCLAAVDDDVYYGSTNGVAKFYENMPSQVPGLTDELEYKYVFDLLLRGDTLWVAYQDGVVLFNRITYQDTLFAIGLTISLCEHDGSVMCAGVNGIQEFVYSGSLGWHWETIGSLPAIPISVSSGGGELFCVSTGAAYRLDGTDWTDITGDIAIPGSMKRIFNKVYQISSGDNILKTVAVDKRGTPWVGGLLELGNRGAYITGYYDGIWHNEAPEQLSQNEVVELSPDPAGGMWMSTLRFGISYLSDSNEWISYTAFRAGVGHDNALSYYGYNLALLYDSREYLWVNALSADLDRLKVNDPFDRGDDEWAHFSMGEGTLTTNRFVKIKEDPAGNMWFLSDDDEREEGKWGINILSADGTDWLSVNPDSVPDMEGGSVFDCAFGGDGRVYLGLRGYGTQAWHTGGYGWDTLSNFDDDVWFTIIGPDQLTSDIVHALARGADGSIWLGTSGGLVRYKSSSIDSLTKKTSAAGEGLVGAIVYDLEFDGGGNLWVASDGGLDKISPDDEITETYTTADFWSAGLQYIYPDYVISPLPSPICRALQYDEGENALWIGTDNGLARFDVSPAAKEEIPLSRVVLYPNPIHLSRGDQALRIWRISEPVSIHVYNIEGELVHEAHGVSEGEVAWDILTISGFIAQSGIYIVRVSYGGHSEMRKVALIR